MRGRRTDAVRCGAVPGLKGLDWTGQEQQDSGGPGVDV